VCRGFCLQLTPVPSCDVEPTLELMTLRLAELVNASGNPQAETSNKVLIAQRGRERPKLCCYVLGVLSSRRGGHTYRRSFAPRCDRCAHTGTERLVHVQVMNSDVLCAPALRQASEGKRGYERRGNQREEGMLPVLASHG
jgi:hypothetical protein